MAEFTNIKINDVKYDVRDAGAARASDLAAKQDVISDLSAIRSGAAAGATAIQQADLAAVATSGSYNDLTNKPTIPAGVTVDQEITQNGTNPVEGGAIYDALENTKTFIVNVTIDYGNDTITADKTFAEIDAAISGGRVVEVNQEGTIYLLAAITSLRNLFYFVHSSPEDSLRHVLSVTKRDVWEREEILIATKSSLQNYVPITRKINSKPLIGDLELTASDVGALPSNTHIPADQVQSNWDETNTSSKAYIQNKPTIPAAQVNADWNATSGVSRILNKPTIPTVPTKVSSFTNDAGYLTQHQSLANYYTKSEIDTKIGNIETILASI